MDIWFQDETRTGQMRSLTRVWHYRGDSTDQTATVSFRLSVCAFCPATKKAVGLVLPFVNKHTVIAYASRLKPFQKDVMRWVMDGVLWSTALNQLMSLCFKLPPYSPELNPLREAVPLSKMSYPIVVMRRLSMPLAWLE